MIGTCSVLLYALLLLKSWTGHLPFSPHPFSLLLHLAFGLWRLICMSGGFYLDLTNKSTGEEVGRRRKCRSDSFHSFPVISLQNSFISQSKVMAPVRWPSWTSLLSLASTHHTLSLPFHTWDSNMAPTALHSPLRFPKPQPHLCKYKCPYINSPQIILIPMCHTGWHSSHYNPIK